MPKGIANSILYKIKWCPTWCFVIYQSMGTYLTIKESWFDLVWLIFDVSFVKEILLNTHPEFEHIQIRNRSTNKIRIIQISQTKNKQK